MTRVVKWYNETKGYGFIQTEDNKDIFVHRTGLENSLRALETGQNVEFELKDGEKGPVAVNVTVA
jgi:CspA family cold shock protein